MPEEQLEQIFLSCCFARYVVYVFVGVDARIRVCACMCISLVLFFVKEDEQRSKVTAHKAALKVIRVIPALGNSCSFPLPRTQ